MLEFAETTHPMFRASSAFERRELRSKEGSKKTIHFDGSEPNVELIPRTIISANQLSVYGQEQICAGRYPKTPWLRGNLKHMIFRNRWKFPTDPPSADFRPDEQRRGNLLQENEQKFEQLSDNQKLSKLCSNAALKIVERRVKYITTLDTAEGLSGMVHFFLLTCGGSARLFVVDPRVCGVQVFVQG